MEGWRPWPRIRLVIRATHLHHKHLNLHQHHLDLNDNKFHHGARDNDHQLDDSTHDNRARHNHNRSSNHDRCAHHDNHDCAHGAHRRTHDDLPADNKHQPAEHNASNRQHQPNVDLFHIIPPGRNDEHRTANNHCRCGYPRTASSQSDRRTAGPGSHTTTSPNRADNNHRHASNRGGTRTEAHMKDELKALPMTLLGSWYVIITLGGSTKTAAIWGTAIGLALHFLLTALLKDNDE